MALLSLIFAILTTGGDALTMSSRTPNESFQAVTHSVDSALGGEMASARASPVRQAVVAMERDGSVQAQIAGCSSMAVDSSKKFVQDEAARDGAIDAIARAMDLFPESAELVTACTRSLASIVLFNRANGLRAGRLGCLNHTLRTYMAHMDSPQVMSLGGAIGAYFDFVDENRAIAREFGGIRAIIQNIKNNFHGRHSEWDYNSVKQSLLALSSGCWTNQDVCAEEGFPALAVRLMAEHGGETKIAEETLQVAKALIDGSEEYRQQLVRLGITDSMVHVMDASKHDQGAVDLACETFQKLVGPSVQQSGRMRAFNSSIQAAALKSGALHPVMAIFTEGTEMQQHEHSVFNFDVNTAYNARRDCFAALAAFAHDNTYTKKTMMDAGFVDIVSAELKSSRTPPDERVAGCRVVIEMSSAATGPQSLLTEALNCR
uniref:Uncharacterized protein n=1 Tax=Alexandrium monilatum TaxID=311494 RepID=A0A7S4QDX2_9DINO|mmetsp:Transcript_72209/g.215473  ORF Transcript_72209/g.215473 Transcript_72209/m.215473 type:complete len:432 (+) Transcript_72209:97-1392(+)